MEIRERQIKYRRNVVKKYSTMKNKDRTTQ